MFIRPLTCLAAALALTGAAVAQPAPGKGGAARGPASVGVVELKREPVPFVVTVPGRAAAVERVEIRPRVDGLIAKLHFEGGERVKTGDMLVSIEDDLYRAEVLAARAAVESAKANVAAAQSKVDRYRKILETGITATEYETAQRELATARSSVSAAEASRQRAEINLDRTKITSPIDGVVDVAGVSVGDVVTANQSDNLTTVTRLDPIYVDIVESSVRILRNRERLAAGIVQRGKSIELRLTLENGTRYDAVGEFVAPGVTVSSTTGTQRIRVRFPNPRRMILPGQFLRVDVTLGTVDAVLIPQGATRRSGDGRLTGFVARDGKAVRVQLTETGTYRNSWIVTEGVEPGDQLIVDGTMNLRAGAEIRTVPVSISAAGVVTDLPGTGGAPQDGSRPAAGE